MPKTLTIYQSLTAKLGRVPTHAEQCAEVARVLGTPDYWSDRHVYGEGLASCTCYRCTGSTRAARAQLART